MRVLVVLGFCLLAATADEGSRKSRSIWPFNKYFSGISQPEITIPGYKFIRTPKSSYASLYGYGADLLKSYPTYTDFLGFNSDSSKSYLSQRYDFPSTYAGKTKYAMDTVGSTYGWPHSYMPYNLKSEFMNPWALRYKTNFNSRPEFYSYAPNHDWTTETSNGLLFKSSNDFDKNKLLSKQTAVKSEAHGFENLADDGLKKGVESELALKNLESKNPSSPAVGYGYSIDLQSSSGVSSLKTPVPMQGVELSEPVLPSVDESYATNIKTDLKDNSEGIGSALPATGYGYTIDLKSSKGISDLKTPVPMERVELKEPALPSVEQRYTVNIESDLKENTASKILSVPALGYGYTIDLQSSGILPNLKSSLPVERVELKAPLLSTIEENHLMKTNVEIPKEEQVHLETKTPELPISGTGYTIDIGSVDSIPNSEKLLVESPDSSITRMGYRSEDIAEEKISSPDFAVEAHKDSLKVPFLGYGYNVDLRSGYDSSLLGMSDPRYNYYYNSPSWPTYGPGYNYYLQASDQMPYGEMKNNLFDYGPKTLSDVRKGYFIDIDGRSRLATKNDNVEIENVNYKKDALPAYGSGYTIDLRSDGNLPSFEPRTVPFKGYGYYLNNLAVPKPEEVYDKYKAEKIADLSVGYSIDIGASSQPLLPEVPTTIINNDYKYVKAVNPYDQSTVDIASRGDLPTTVEPVDDGNEFKTAKLPDFGSGYTIDLSSNEKALYKPDNIVSQAPGIDKSDSSFSPVMEISNAPVITQEYKTGSLPEFGSGYSIDLRSNGGLQNFDASKTGKYIDAKSYKLPSYGTGYHIDFNSAGKMPMFGQNYLKSSNIPMLDQGYSIDLSSEHMSKTPIKEENIYFKSTLPSAGFGYYLNMDSRQGFDGRLSDHGLNFGRYGDMMMQTEPRTLCRNHCEQIVTFRGKTLRTPYRGYMTSWDTKP